MVKFPEGKAIVYCEGAFNTTNGKTAHGLVRYSRRYDILSVIDSRYAGQDAGDVLDGISKNIPIYRDLSKAINTLKESGNNPTHFVIGIAPDGGRIDLTTLNDIYKAIELGLNVDSGLHDFLVDDTKAKELSILHGIKIRDIRNTPPRKQLHFFCGKIEEVKCLKIALLGTDSAIGKRTTAWILENVLKKLNYKTEMIGTGQTAWMQGAKYGIILDSLINDFIAGEIEHVIWKAWRDEKPQVIIIEGQGSLMNPAYPGSFEILAAGRPDVVVLQHAPGRKDYDGFPNYPMHSLTKQIKAIELISGKPVIAITINHENLIKQTIPKVCEDIENETGLPTCDPLIQGVNKVIKALQYKLEKQD